MRSHLGPPALTAVLLMPFALAAAPSLETTDTEIRVTAPSYRVAFQRAAADFSIELKGANGGWFPVARALDRPAFGIAGRGGALTTSGARAEVKHQVTASCIIVGSGIFMGSDHPSSIETHFLCTDEGILVRFQLTGGEGADGASWPMPRIPLDLAVWDRYAFWNEADALRSETIASLGDKDRFAGVSPWGRAGDTSARLSQRHPCVCIGSTAMGVSLGAVFLNYESSWAKGYSFVQRHTPYSLFFYSGLAPSEAARDGLWAWLAPMPAGAPAASKIEALLARGEQLIAEFRPIAPAIDPALLRPVPDFPEEQRRSAPVSDIREAIVYTINEYIDSDRGIRAAAKTGSDVLIRGWFKWHDAQNWASQSHVVPKAHALGALFGGGVTCSALYHGENGLPEERVLDMATRGPDGKLVDAWGEAGTRHGSLSNPAYLEYVLSFCKRQIDAGADYLFMDEIKAALHPNEGFDDHSIRDFRRHLLRDRPDGAAWSHDDRRWRDVFGIDLSDRIVCPDGTIDTFDYRAFLQKRGLTGKPHAPANPLAPEWMAFRDARDDRAWKWMTDRIREYAASRGRKVLISGNGLARYVDLQVLGVWGLWKAKGGKIDLSTSLVDQWSGTVAAGRAMADGPVPVVFFHDWGFGGFPWIRDVPPEERELWMRVRGAEIYASGAFFAFPVAGPWGNDALVDGTIREIARQAHFYRSNRNLYLGARFAGFEGIDAGAEDLSVALWKRETRAALILHVINRQARDSKPIPRDNVGIVLPTAAAPTAVRILSPDWEGERPGVAKIEGGRLRVTIPRMDAYAVAILDYAQLPDVALGGPRIGPVPEWSWIKTGPIIIGADGMPTTREMPGSFLHGNLHGHLRKPHAFSVNMPRGGKLRVRINAVATLGARIECQVDAQPPIAEDLPDLDHSNDASAPEYERVLVFEIPPGRHEVVIRNTGGDWAHLSWYAFDGQTAPW